MELANRNRIEGEFASRMARLHGTLRTRAIELMGEPPDPTRIPDSFWIEAEEEMRRELAIILLLIWGASARQHGLGADMVDVHALRYAELRSRLVAPQWAGNSRARLTDLIGRGGRPVEVAAEVFSPSRAESIATTETTTATSAGGELATVQTVGITELDTWFTAADDRVCRICGPLHASPRSQWMARFPDGPPAHPNCILPGAVVEGRVIGGLKATYSGQAVEFLTASGIRLAVTANHPVLTEAGFLPACRIAKGDNLVRQLGEVKLPGFVTHNEQDVPATIEQVFSAIAKRGNLQATANPSAVDLHGDETSLNGKVDIVLSARMLLADYEAASKKLARKGCLVAADMQQLGVSSGSSPRLNRERVGSRTARLPGFCELPLNGRSIGLNGSPLQPLLLGSGAKNCAVVEKMLDEPERRAVLESTAANPGFYRKLIQGLSGVVSPDQVVNVRNFEWRGHVYDLQTLDGWLYSNGIVVHNCRCWVKYAAEITELDYA